MYSVVHALTVLLFHFSSDFYLVLRYYQKKMHLRSVLQLNAGLCFTLLLIFFCCETFFFYFSLKKKENSKRPVVPLLALLSTVFPLSHLFICHT